MKLIDILSTIIALVFGLGLLAFSYLKVNLTKKDKDTLEQRLLDELVTIPDNEVNNWHAHYIGEQLDTPDAVKAAVQKRLDGIEWQYNYIN